MTDHLAFRRRLGGIEYVVPMPVHWDPLIGDHVATGADLEIVELEIASQATNAQPTGDAFSWVRRALGFTGKQLGAKLGVRLETISRWERGELPIDRKAWLLLGSLARERAGKPVELSARMDELAKTPRKKRKRRA